MPESFSHLRELQELVARAHMERWYHKKRGFCLGDATPKHATLHLVEEALEAHAEVLFGTRTATVSELGDMLGCLLHYLYMTDTSLDEVCEAGIRNLFEKLVQNKEEIESQTPGVTRQARHVVGVDLGKGPSETVIGVFELDEHDNPRLIGESRGEMAASGGNDPELPR